MDDDDFLIPHPCLTPLLLAPKVVKVPKDAWGVESYPETKVRIEDYALPEDSDDHALTRWHEARSAVQRKVLEKMANGDVDA